MSKNPYTQIEKPLITLVKPKEKQEKPQQQKQEFTKLKELKYEVDWQELPNGKDIGYCKIGEDVVIVDFKTTNFTIENCCFTYDKETKKWYPVFWDMYKYALKIIENPYEILSEDKIREIESLNKEIEILNKEKVQKEQEQGITNLDNTKERLFVVSIAVASILSSFFISPLIAGLIVTFVVLNLKNVFSMRLLVNSVIPIIYVSQTGDYLNGIAIFIGLCLVFLLKEKANGRQ